MKGLRITARYAFTAALIGTLAGCGGGGGGGSSDTGGGGAGQGSGGGPVTREIAIWEGNMRSWGGELCRHFQTRDMDDEHLLAETYYDAQNSFYKIADYTGESSWDDCARAAGSVYRDRYVRANNGQIPAYWNFTEGLTEDYLRTGDERSREAVMLLADNAAYASDISRLDETVPAEMSREVAYSIMAYLNAETLGAPRRGRLAPLVDQALGHIDQWFVSRRSRYIRPFMVSLTGRALAQYHAATGDPRVIPALVTAADSMWKHLWVPEARAFKYSDRAVDSEGDRPAPDLNLLIAPLYSWLYEKTGDPKYREEAQEIFSGGVSQAFLANGKQFNQNYRWSFDVVRVLSH